MIDHGRGVRLGPIDSGHNETLRTWRNDYRVWKTCRQNDLISDVDQERWFRKQSEDPAIKMYMIYNSGNVAVGVCGLTSIDPWNHRAEFSLYIAPDHQGEGLGSQALQTLLDHAFDTLGINLVWGESFEGNAACRMFEKIGFQKEGVRRDFYYRDGRYLDAHLFSVKRAEWVGRRSCVVYAISRAGSSSTPCCCAGRAITA